jgi:hypothetical protein
MAAVAWTGATETAGLPLPLATPVPLSGSGPANGDASAVGVPVPAGGLGAAEELVVAGGLGAAEELGTVAELGAAEEFGAADDPGPPKLVVTTDFCIAPLAWAPSAAGKSTLVVVAVADTRGMTAAGAALLGPLGAGDCAAPADVWPLAAAGTAVAAAGLSAVVVGEGSPEGTWYAVPAGWLLGPGGALLPTAEVCSGRPPVAPASLPAGGASAVEGRVCEDPAWAAAAWACAADASWGLPPAAFSSWP